MYKDTNLMLQGLMLVCQGWILRYFFEAFLECQERFRNEKRLMVISGFVLGMYGIDCILTMEYGIGRIIVKLVLELLLLYLLMILCYKAEKELGRFLVITFLAISENCYFLAYTVLQLGPYVAEICLSAYEQGYLESEVSFMKSIELAYLGLQVGMYTVFVVLLYVFIKKFVSNFRKKEYVMSKREVCFILTPNLVGLLLCVILRLIMITVENGMQRLLYDTYPPLIVLVPIILLLSLMSILYSVKLFQDMIELNEERNSRIILERQIVSMQQHVQVQENMYASVRGLKHDMKNTLAIIGELARNEETIRTGELQRYILEWQENVEMTDTCFKTGNSVVDVLLNMKCRGALHLIPDIEIEAEDLLFPTALQIEGYDLGIVLGNALDNAIEACQKQKKEKPEGKCYISLASKMRGNVLLLEIENSFNGKITQQKGSAFPGTDKKDKKLHGIGLINIKATAEKYGGAVEWSTEGNTFYLTILLKNEKQMEVEG